MDRVDLRWSYEGVGVAAATAKDLCNCAMVSVYFAEKAGGGGGGGHRWEALLHALTKPAAVASDQQHEGRPGVAMGGRTQVKALLLALRGAADQAAAAAPQPPSGGGDGGSGLALRAPGRMLGSGGAVFCVF